MSFDERGKYKSWSDLKKQMNDLLCDSLKDSISYFYTSYHEAHNSYGRAASRVGQAILPYPLGSRGADFSRRITERIDRQREPSEEPMALWL